MLRRIEARGRITLTKGLKDSKRFVDLKGTIPILNVSHVMRKATLQKIASETKDRQERTRRRGIMHIVLEMMNQQEKEQDKTLLMKNMFRFQHSQEHSPMEAIVSL